MKYATILALRKERERRGWSRNYVAERIEVDIMTVGRWERGERLPHSHHRQKLCTLFELEAQDLGLLPDLPQEPNDASIMPESPPEVSDMIIAVSHPSPQVNSTQKKVISTSSQWLYNRRRLLLTGLVGGIGAIALLGSSLPLISHKPTTSTSTPVVPIPMPLSKRTHHFLDPNLNNFVNYMAWSPNNSAVALANGSNVVSIWNIEAETLIMYYPTLNGWVNDISWSKTNVIAAATADLHNGALQLWKYPDQKPIFTLQRPYGLRSVSWSSNGQYLALSGHTSTVEVWDTFASRMVSQYTYPALGLLGIRRVKWSPSGKFLACATDDGTAHVWDALTLTGKPKTIYRGHKSRLIDLSWSPNEQYIVTSGTDKTCQVWEALSGRSVLTYRGHTSAVEGVAWSPRGNYIASASGDRTAHVWEALTGKLITKYTGYSSIPEAVLWSVDGRTLVIGTEKEGVEIWQAP